MHAYIPTRAAMQLIANLEYRGDHIDYIVGGFGPAMPIARLIAAPMPFTQCAIEASSSSSTVTPLHGLIQPVLSVRGFEKANEWLALRRAAIVRAVGVAALVAVVGGAILLRRVNNTT